MWIVPEFVAKLAVLRLKDLSFHIDGLIDLIVLARKHLPLPFRKVFPARLQSMD